jgi:uncharacterized protein (UPF0332 family)
MDGREFLSLADELAAGGTAAHRRSALSRAYYAAYHTAYELLSALGIALPRDHRGHERVRQCLQYSDDASLNQAGAVLRRLQTVRVKADYHLRDPHPEHPRTVELYLSQARRCIALLDATPADPAARAALAAAIRRALGEGGPGS